MPDSFNRDSLAKWYAKQHLKTDPAVRSIYYLPTDAPEREIRFIEVNELIADINDDALEPIDFGVDTGMESEHKVVILDVTPRQWTRIRQPSLSLSLSLSLPLPQGWSLTGAMHFKPKA